jgi:hypothetical protein
MLLSTISPLCLVVVGVFYIFLIWVLWMVVKSLKGIDASLKEIARNSPNKL